MLKWFNKAGAVVHRAASLVFADVEGDQKRLAQLRGELAAEVAAKEQLAEALNDSEARRRELELLLEAPRHTIYSAWKEGIDDTLTWATEHPEETRSAAEVAAQARICDDILTRLVVYRNALNRDQTGLAAAMVRVMRCAESYFWVTEERGPYEWDDVRYRQETGTALEMIIFIARAGLTTSGSIADDAINGFQLRAGASRPLGQIVNGLLIDHLRLAEVLRKNWSSITSVATESIPYAAFDNLDPSFRDFVTRIARATLHAAISGTDGGIDPIERAVFAEPPGGAATAA